MPFERNLFRPVGVRLETGETETMADGKEEREESKARLEEKKTGTRRGECHDDEPIYEGQPERGGS